MRETRDQQLQDVDVQEAGSEQTGTERRSALERAIPELSEYGPISGPRLRGSSVGGSEIEQPELQGVLLAQVSGPDPGKQPQGPGKQPPDPGPQQPPVQAPKPQQLGKGEGIDPPSSPVNKVEAFRRDRQQVTIARGSTSMDISKLKPAEQEVIQEAIDVIEAGNKAKKGTYSTDFLLLKDKASGEVVRALRIRNNTKYLLNPTPDEIPAGAGESLVEAVQLHAGGELGNLPERHQAYRNKQMNGYKPEKGSPFMFLARLSDKSSGNQFGSTGDLWVGITLDADGEPSRSLGFGRTFRVDNPPIVSLRRYYGEVPEASIAENGKVKVQVGEKPAGIGKTEPELAELDMARFTPELPAGHALQRVAIERDKAYRASDGYRIPFTLESSEADGKGEFKAGTRKLTEGYFTIAAGPDTYDPENGTIRNPNGYKPGTRYINGAVVRGRRIDIP